MFAQLMQHCLSAKEGCLPFDTIPKMYVHCGMASWCSLLVTYHQPWQWCYLQKKGSNMGTSAQLWHLLRENCSNKCLGFSSKNSFLLGPFLFSTLFSGLQEVIIRFKNHRQRALCFKHCTTSELKLPQAVYLHQSSHHFQKKNPEKSFSADLADIALFP